ETFIDSLGAWTYSPSSDGWNFTDFASDFGKSSMAQPTYLSAYDYDCVMRSDGRTDCMELAVRRPLPYYSGNTSATVLLRQASVGTDGVAGGWVNYALPASPAP